MVDLQRLAKAEANCQNSFFRAEGAIERLKAFVVSNSHIPRSGNCIFWGPGGYGKSEMGYQFIKEATGQEPFVVNLNQATTAAEMYGGVDIEKFAAGQGIEYLIGKSFMEHEWVIFEEGLEPRARVLSALKHILTSGVFAPAGSGAPINIKTKGILIVTNIDTADFKQSLDTQAFLERFPFEYSVSWNHLNAHERYEASLKVVDKFDPDGMISSTYRENIAKTMSDRKQSPRIISRAVQSMVAYATAYNRKVDTEIYQTVAGLLNFGTQDMSKKIVEDKQREEAKKVRQAYEDMFSKIRENTAHYLDLRSDFNDPRYIIQLGGEIQSTFNLLQSLGDNIVEMRTSNALGQYGDEIASWVNSQIGDCMDKLEGIKNDSFMGMLRAVVRLSDENERLKAKIEEAQVTEGE